MISLNNSQKNYDGDDPYLSARVKVTSSDIEYTFRNLPSGTYAVKAFHDEDSDNELDMYFWGPPAEAYGFSNNARGMFGPPNFDDAKFAVENGEKRISITLK